MTSSNVGSNVSDLHIFMEQSSNQTSKIMYTIFNFMKKICIKNGNLYFCDITLSSTSVFH